MNLISIEIIESEKQKEKNLKKYEQISGDLCNNKQINTCVVEV
jgi:hypothetical protein